MKKKKQWLILVALFVVFLFGLLFVGWNMSNVEQPKYRVAFSQGAIQIRNYEPMVIAHVQVSGERKESIEQGFRLLAGYIFGSNQIEKEIAMTAPVMQQPVQQAWQVSFVMPAEYSVESLPVPNNQVIRLEKISAKQFAVVRFSGTVTNEKLAKQEKQLMDYVAEKKLTVVGLPKYAFYDPPWTLPFLRRNEVMVEIQNY